MSMSKTLSVNKLELRVNKAYGDVQSRQMSFVKATTDPVLATPAITANFVVRAVTALSARGAAFSVGASAVGGAYALGGRWR